MSFPRSTWARLTLAVMLLLPCQVLGQSEPPQWVSLDALPPGSPPTIQLVDSPSDFQQSVLFVTIHGFWLQNILEDGAVFQRISLDRNRDGTRYGQVGRPELPALHHMLAALVGDSVGPPVVVPYEQVPFDGMLIYPLQDWESSDPDAPPPPFQWDREFYYETEAVYPLDLGAAAGPMGKCMGVRLVAAETYPFRYVPSLGRLIVTKSFQVTIPHPGAEAQDPTQITHRKKVFLDPLVDNSGTVDIGTVSVDAVFSDYLIITHSAFLQSLQPLIAQKTARGHTVTVVTTAQIGSTCDAIRNHIKSWWHVAPTAHDHYVLLVGGPEVLPLCTSHYGNPTDQLYCCIEGEFHDGQGGVHDDPFPDLFLGRLTPNTPAECSDMVAKILQYEDHTTGDWPMNVALVAHKRRYPDGFTLWQEAVASAYYASPPSFTKAYGGAGCTNSALASTINLGVGIISYAGWGNAGEWFEWNRADQSFGVNEIAALQNGTKTPVLLDFGYNTGNIFVNNCLTEIWMKTRQRAVAAYGDIGAESPDAASILDAEVFKALFQDGLTTLGEALAAGTFAAVQKTNFNLGESNAWNYLLLGDPELKVYRRNPVPIIVGGPGQINAGQQQISFDVLDATGRAVPWAVVSLYKEGEVFANGYTDEQGACVIDIDPTTPGTIQMTAYTEEGDEGVAGGQIQVNLPAGVGSPDGGAVTLRLDPISPNPLAGEAALRYSLPREGATHLEIVDSSGRRVVTLVDGDQKPGSHQVLWNRTGTDGRRVAGGLYFARLTFGPDRRTTKVIILH